MAVLQELSADQIDELIGMAVARTVPLIITIRTEASWDNLHSRMLAVRGTHLLVELPCVDPKAAPHEFVPSERVGMSFKLKHYKHLFTATVVGQERIKLPDGTEAPALAVVLPSRMQRLQRRAFIRADVPPNRIVRASFWMGGCDCEPAGTSPQRPVWSGRVTNISAGGFQLATEPQAAEGLESGDPVGVRLVFGTDGQAIYADAQFRYAQMDRDRALLGFQFIGLTETPEGRAALQMISANVSAFQRSRKGTGAFKHN